MLSIAPFKAPCNLPAPAPTQLLSLDRQTALEIIMYSLNICYRHSPFFRMLCKNTKLKPLPFSNRSQINVGGKGSQFWANYKVFVCKHLVCHNLPLITTRSVYAPFIPGRIDSGEIDFYLGAYIGNTCCKSGEATFVGKSFSYITCRFSYKDCWKNQWLRIL